MREYNEIDLLDEIRAEAQGQFHTNIKLAEIISVKPLKIKFNNMIIEQDQIFMLNNLHEKQYKTINTNYKTVEKTTHNHQLIYDKLQAKDLLLIYVDNEMIIIIDKVVKV